MLRSQQHRSRSSRATGKAHLQASWADTGYEVTLTVWGMLPTLTEGKHPSATTTGENQAPGSRQYTITASDQTDAPISIDALIDCFTGDALADAKMYIEVTRFRQPGESSCDITVDLAALMHNLRQLMNGVSASV
ncbi:MAG TPA: hypothetical protein VLG92_02950 [Candidatus Saccharimonadia bacterium]|nr:hypothetical protein [Candidatus Saccharimonadia bacterium]